MGKQVLIVDDNQELLLALKDGIERYDDTLSVLMAGNGQIAVEKLKANPISIVVTDLKMPRMDGLSLLGYIMENYPDIPVIIMTAYGTPELEKLAHEGGAIDYIAKPFNIQDLARKIINILRKESEGGVLKNIDSEVFLQLVWMGQKTCTIRVVEKPSGKLGVLFFKGGELLDARAGSLQGEGAAYEIFSWEDVTISIQDDCFQKEKKIRENLQAILLEAMRRKDEVGHSENKEVTSEEEKKPEKRIGEEGNSNLGMNQIFSKIKGEFGDRHWVKDIYVDHAWDGLMKESRLVGSFLGTGELKVCYIDRGESSDFILLPGRENIVISVDTKCPKERMMEFLSSL